MDLRHLRVFVAVAEALSFRRAAETLHLAQPAVSATIADLEKSLGATLLDRSRHHVAVTPVGRGLLAEARRLLADADAMQARARRLALGEVGRLRIGFLASATAHFLPGAIRDYRARHPQVTISAEELSPEQQVADLLADRIDLALTRPIRGQDALAQRTLYDDRLLLALAKDHTLAQRTTVGLSACADVPFVLYHRAGSAELFAAVMGLCRQAGFSPHIVQEVRNLATALMLVAAGQGISLVPGCAVHLAQADIHLLPTIPRSPAIPLVAAWRTGQADPLVDGFVTVLRARLRGGH
jgi:DNA-binding transcriptional LysR family regulator